MPKVEQRDRDAAARLNGCANWAVWEATRQTSEEWMILCAKDFAAHRIAATAIAPIGVDG